MQSVSLATSGVVCSLDLCNLSLGLLRFLRSAIFKKEDNLLFSLREKMNFVKELTLFTDIQKFFMKHRKI